MILRGNGSGEAIYTPQTRHEVFLRTRNSPVRARGGAFTTATSSVPQTPQCRPILHEVIPMGCAPIGSRLSGPTCYMRKCPKWKISQLRRRPIALFTKAASPLDATHSACQEVGIQQVMHRRTDTIALNQSSHHLKQVPTRYRPVGVL